jgi:hypothetical protein
MLRPVLIEGFYWNLKEIRCPQIQPYDKDTEVYRYSRIIIRKLNVPRPIFFRIPAAFATWLSPSNR